MMANTNELAVNQYLEYLNKYADGDEIQYRTAIETLFNAVKLPPKTITIIQEDRRSGLEIDGMPDFFVYEDYTADLKSLVGFIECKKPSYNLDKLIESEQIKKYAKTCENIILTNYHRFILLQKGKKIHDMKLTSESTVIQDFMNILQDFYGYVYPYISTKKSLVASLSAQSFYFSVALRQYIENQENETEDFYTKFNGFFGEYQNSINYYYDLADFCDIYSQSLVYGLLLARLDTQKDLDEKNTNYIISIPAEYKLLKEFLSQAYESNYLPTSLKIALTNIGKNINLINTETIQNEFNKANDGKQNIAVYLYEDFLQQYDDLRKTEKRKEGGVYYTPREATDFITRSVNDLIKTQFNLPKGYLSENIKVLDFACGTGTFLHSIFEIMLENNPDEFQKSIIKQKIAQDIYGFELLFTPYIVAHTFLSLYLKNNGIHLDGDRLGVYLTNTLDISQHSISSFLPVLKREYERAMKIKGQESILAIVGNPPYNVNSQSKNEVVISMLKDYIPQKEANVKPLYNDYVKFIRFAQYKIEQSKTGIIGIITDNSFLDNLTYYKMREELLNKFDSIYIVNLHGKSGNKGGISGDKNIFPITQGVCISILIKNSKLKKHEKGIFYYSVFQDNILSRAEKLDFLTNTKLQDIKFTKLNPLETKEISFIPRDLTHKDEYQNFIKLNEIFNNPTLPIMSKKDYANKTQTKWIAYQYRLKDLERLRNEFITLYPNELIKKYQISEESDWKVVDAQKDLTKTFYNPKEIQFRIWDNRYTSLSKSKGFLARPSYDKIAKHFEYENIGLLFERGCRNKFNHIFITEKYTDFHVIGLGSYLAPLYHYNGGNGYAEMDFDGHKRYANFTQNFIKNYIEQIDFQPTPEEILAYIYAVLHSPIYRKKYVEFLKTDFPAVPMTKNKAIFEQYAALGQNLIDLHLLSNFPDDKEISVSGGIPEREFLIEKISTANDRLFLHTNQNKTIDYKGVTSEIYNFEIGSYRPIEKWLKYRIKDKVSLSISDLNHLKNMILAIKNTILVMGKIERLGEGYLKDLDR